MFSQHLLLSQSFTCRLSITQYRNTGHVFYFLITMQYNAVQWNTYCPGCHAFDWCTMEHATSCFYFPLYKQKPLGKCVSKEIQVEYSLVCHERVLHNYFILYHWSDNCMVHDGKAGCNTIEYDWLYFIQHVLRHNIIQSRLVSSPLHKMKPKNCRCFLHPPQ